MGSPLFLFSTLPLLFTVVEPIVRTNPKDFRRNSRHLEFIF